MKKKILFGLDSGAALDHPCQAVVELAARSGFAAIQWRSGHVPIGDVRLALAIREDTLDWGLTPITYDADWRVGETGFPSVLNTAVALGAKLVRVSVGASPFASASQDERAKLCAEVAAQCDLARRAAVSVSIRTRTGTLVDSHRARLWLMRNVGHPNLRFDWEQCPDRDHEDLLDDLTEVLPRLACLHLDARLCNESWLDCLRLASNRRRFAIVEALAITNLVRDVAALRDRLNQLNMLDNSARPRPQVRADLDSTEHDPFGHGIHTRSYRSLTLSASARP